MRATMCFYVPHRTTDLGIERIHTKYILIRFDTDKIFLICHENSLIFFFAQIINYTK